MANLASAKIRVKHNKKRAEINANRLNAVRTQVKKTETALKAGDKKAAAESMKATEASLARAAQKGVMKKAAAARKISRLSAQIKKAK